jgi:hypothetical protein
MSTKNNRNGYQSKRRSNDEFFRVSGDLRAALSMCMRRMTTNEKQTVRSKVLERYLGVSFEMIYARFARQAEILGYDLAADYGTALEINHRAPVASFRVMSDAVGVEKAMLAAFQWQNLEITTKTANRSHCSVTRKLISQNNVGKKKPRSAKNKVA